MAIGSRLMKKSRPAAVFKREFIHGVITRLSKLTCAPRLAMRSADLKTFVAMSASGNGLDDGIDQIVLTLIFVVG